MGTMTQGEINISLFDEVKKLQAENAIIKKGIAAVRSLINESSGVAGLHANGDVAFWESLERGGRCEEWLEAFNAAEDV